MWNTLKHVFHDRAFVLCVISLGAAAAGLDVVTQAMGVRFRKQAVPLRLPLSDPSLKERLLPRYEFLQAVSIPKDSEEALGTDQYILWRFRDTTRKPGDPLSVVSVFITYYTGTPEQVPHVPDVCYQGDGYVEKESGMDSVEIPALGPKGKSVPIRTLTFEKAETLRTASPTVSYLFSVNGQFRATRNEVRIVMSYPLDRYAYFSKIEIRFGRGFDDPPRAQAIQATKELLAVLLPILNKYHYADWDALTKKNP